MEVAYLGMMSFNATCAQAAGKSSYDCAALGCAGLRYPCAACAMAAARPVRDLRFVTVCSAELSRTTLDESDRQTIATRESRYDCAALGCAKLSYPCAACARSALCYDGCAEPRRAKLAVRDRQTIGYDASQTIFSWIPGVE